MRQDAGKGLVDAVMERLRSHRRLPVSTYRLQFNLDFTFDDARSLVPYLHSLGVTDCYSSPYLRARPGSPHGYDICDHGVLNPDLGGSEEYEAFVAELKKHGMGQILDVVPNHMSGCETSNAKWMDVLENGPSSPYAAFFDIDWHPLRSDTHLENRVLLPILGDAYGTVLENQELALAYEDGAFFVGYYEHRLPVDPKSYVGILQLCEAGLVERTDLEDEHLLELQSIITALAHLPDRTEDSPERVMERQREKEVIKRRLRELHDDSEPVREAIAWALDAYRGVPGDASSFDRLDELLEQQPYRLAHWQVAAEEINYRRFFDVNDLVALRQEDPQVFEESHRLVMELLREGKVTGLRIDHPDGLWDPAVYFARLQEGYLRELSMALLAEAGEPTEDRWPAMREALAGRLGREIGDGGNSSPPKPLYIVAEKILSNGEDLPRQWAVHGTTGYEFANAVNGIFVDGSSSEAFDLLYRRFTGRDTDQRQLVYSCKKMIMLVSLASEINMLGYQLKRIAGRYRKYRDFTLNSLTLALREVVACLPVYRTYIGDEVRGVDARDRAYIEEAVEEARKRNASTAPAVFDFVRDTLLLRWPEGIGEEEQTELLDFVRKFQQTTGPVMAKAVEDTAFYVHNRLLSINEVGGDPGQFGTEVSEFHRQNAERRRWWPYSLLATSTHDTKRSEDVRARIDVLSELPREWKAAVTHWSRLNRKRKATLQGREVPCRNEEYYLYQTLLGAWPLEPMEEAGYRIFVERIQAHMVKAIKEARVNTSWVSPNLAYEEAMRDFVHSILDRVHANPFLKDFRRLQEKVAHYGVFNSLSQTLLKIASPGVPDLYQGTELWDFSLVDPDNRRPVDYELRERMLYGLRDRIASLGQDRLELARELLDSKEDGRIKMYVVHLGLSYRREHPDVFLEGDYLPLQTAGRQGEHLVAFARGKGSRMVVAVVPRLVARLTRGQLIPPVGAELWGDGGVRLPAGEAGTSYRNVFTGEVVEVAPLEGGGAGLPASSVLAAFPVALLERV